VNAYRIDGELGRGGMAVVHAGFDPKLARPVALKVLAAHLAGDAEFRSRFLREARLASRLHHEHLIRVFDVTELDGLPCIVMELLPGGTLEHGSLSRADGAAIAAGLAHAHAQGVVHRDLKPANLLRAADGTVKIVDFGIARAVEETMMTQVGTVLGTLRYLAPEQASGLVAGPKADVYALGVVLDELLEPKTAADRRLIERCRARDPAARPTASEVAAQLLSGPTASAAQTVVLRRPARRARAVAVLAVSAAVAAVVAVLATRGGGNPAPVAPVRHASTAAQQARNLESWLREYSR